MKPIVLAMTGASGAVYATRLLEALLAAEREVHLVISDAGASVCKQELGVAPRLDGSNLDDLLRASGQLLGVESEPRWDFQLLNIHHPKDYFTPIASGSFLTDGMVICPCSGSTLSGIARSASENLIQRAAEVHLKEHRKLIVVPRETPLSTFQLENMHRLSQAGVVVLPAAPGWYHGVSGLIDLVDFVVARVLDQLEISNQRITRWASKASHVD
jgi:flavin prenyltransferase